MKSTNLVRNRKTVATLMIGLSIGFSIISLFLVQRVSAVNRTWDNGGGADQNWSNPLNWSGDTVPGTGDIAVFDAASGNSTIDGAFAGSVAGIQINAGFAGTITQAVNLTVGTSGFTQNAGTFNASNGTLQMQGNFSVAASATFAANSGTLVFNGGGNQPLTLPGSLTLNNVEVNKPTGTVLFFNSGASNLVIAGTLTLTDGGLQDNTGVSTFNAQGPVTIAPAFDGGSGPLLVSGTAARTITLPVGAGIPRMTVNAANVTLNTSGAGTITFTQPFAVTDCTSFTNGPVNFVFDQPFTFGPTTNFTLGSGNITFQAAYTQTGGTFSPGTGALTFNSDLLINAGSFNAPSGLLQLKTTFTVGASATFLHNGGTVVFNGTGSQPLTLPGSLTLNNVEVNKPTSTVLFFNSGATNLVIAGTLTLTDGGLQDNTGVSTFNAQGPVTIAAAFDGGSGPLLVSGTATRTITLPVGAGIPRMTVNAANVTLNTSGAGTITFTQPFAVTDCTSFTNGPVNFVFDHPFTFGPTTNFTLGSGNVTFQAAYTQTGGTFNPGIGALTFNSDLLINAGTFNAPSGLLQLKTTFTVGASATFLHNGGTVVFNGTGSQPLTLPGSLTLNNVEVNKPTGTVLFFNSGATNLVIAGTLTLTDGGLQDNTGVSIFNPQANISIASTFDGGSARISLTGSADQTYTNAGGVNPTGTWTINKTGGVVTLLSNLTLLTTQALNITSGELNQGASASITAGTITVAAAGTWRNHGAGGLTIGNSVSNAGVIDFDGGSAPCSGADAILIRSSVDGAVRTWTVPGGATPGFVMQDVDVKDQGGTAVITAFSSTNSGNNAANWTFDNGELQLVWDGGGATNNWSEAANWNRNLVPNSCNIVNFSNASTKNATIDTNVSIFGVRINTGYSGTISQAAGTSLTINGVGLTQSAGTLATGAGSTLTVNADYTLTTGTFNGAGANSNVDINGNLLLNGGTFTAPNGQLFVSGNLTRTSGTFTTTAGGVTFDGSTNSSVTVASSHPFHGFTVNKTGGTNVSVPAANTFLINGPLNLLDGFVNTVTLNSRNDASVGTDFEGGTGSLQLNGGTAFDNQYVFNGGAELPSNVVMNNATASLQMSGTSVIVFQSLTLSAGTFVQAAAPINFLGNYSQTAGTFSGGSASLAFGNSGSQTFSFTGGSFTSTSASLSFSGSTFTISGGTFSHNNGTVIFGQAASINVPASTTFNNLTFPFALNTVVSNSLLVLGNLSFRNGNVSMANANDPIEVRGNVELPGSGSATSVNLILSGTQQTINATNPPTLSKLPGNLTINSSNTVVVVGRLTMDPGHTLAINSGIFLLAPGVELSTGAVTISANGVFRANTNASISLGGNVVNNGLVDLQGGGNTCPSSDLISLHSTSTTQRQWSGSGTNSLSDVAVSRMGSATPITVFNGTDEGNNTNWNFTDGCHLEVTNTNDSGVGSFRQALVNANQLPNRDLITFNITGSAPFSIAPTNGLPQASFPVVIDATTQSGFAGTPIVELSGASLSQPANGLIIGGGNSIVKGLVINRFVNGILLAGPNGNLIQGNFIGTNITGSAALPNQVGIVLNDAQLASTVVGGTTSSAKNVISGNVNAGISIGGPSLGSAPIVHGNNIGTNAAGTSGIPNGTGILINKNNVTIGGVGVGQSNIIAFNQSAGVKVTSGTGNSIRGNSIHSNGALGIDLDPSGINQNDQNDLDSGPNNKQNFPIIDAVLLISGNTSVQGSLNSAPSQNYTIDFYSTPTCDSSGNGEGQTYLGSTVVSTTSSSIATLNATLPLTTSGLLLTATATDSQGNTSEFSPCRIIAPQFVSISGRVVDNNGQPLPSTLIQLSGGQSQTTFTNNNGDYSLTNIPSSANYTVTPSRVNYDFVPSSRPYSNIIINQTNQNYTGTRNRASITGTLRATINGISTPAINVSVNLSGAASRTFTGNGGYYFHDLNPGMYTITPLKDGLAFNPSSVDVSLTSTNQTVNLNATQASPLEGRIFFWPVGWIKSINANGTAISEFLTMRFTFSHPDVTSDGRRMVYVRETTAGNRAIFTANADGTGESLLIDHSTLQEVSPAWSPDNSKVAYTTYVSTDPSVLRVVNANGTGATSISISGITNIQSPSWLDADTIIFSGFDGSDSEIYSVNTNGSALTNLTNNISYDVYPKVSPNGTKIAFLNFATSSSAGTNLKTMNPDGTGQLQIRTDITRDVLTWSPDGAWLAVVQKIGSNAPRTVAVNSATGGNVRLIYDGVLNTATWAPDYEFPTPTGNSVPVNTGGVNITFGGVSTAGTTTITPISSSAAGTAPNGFVVGGMAFEISTTAAYTAPITVCFVVPNHIATTQTQFNQLGLLHNEVGVLVDRTTSRTFSTRTICGSVNTLSPFALGQQVNSSLSSITGLLLDGNGSPMSDVFVQLTGTEEGTAYTDVFGFFTFPNLTPGGNYNVQPKQVGYIFSDYSKTFTNLNGENPVVFTGTQSQFQISGRVTDVNGFVVSGAVINLEGAINTVTTTNANGDFSFSDLPADGLYRVIPGDGGPVFSPTDAQIDALTSNVDGVDFVQTTAAPTPSPSPSPSPSPGLNYTAIGDSVSFGTGDTQGGFTTRYQGHLQTDLSVAVTQNNFGVFGAFSTNLLNQLQTDQSVRTAIANSQVVTFNIGGNDLGLAINQYRAAQCGGADNLNCVRTALTLLKSNLTAIVAELLALRSTNNTVIRTMDLYNPIVVLEKNSDSWPNDGGLNDFQALKPFGDDFNNFIVTLAAANKIPCARASIAFNGPHNDEDAVAKGLIAADGVHPSPAGHALLANLLRATAYEPVAVNNGQPNVQIAVGDYAVSETVSFVTISVVRGGKLNAPLTVNYATADGTASQHGDYITSIGRVNFAAGELLKTIPLLIVNDVHDEPNETFTLTLSSPSAGSLVAPASSNIVITSNDSGMPQTNPLDDARFFAQEHYFDFLNRFPDQSGWDFWTNEIVLCGSNQQCIEVKRINVSAAFYLSIEFQETGYFVERMYKTAYGDALGTSTLGGAHQISVPIIRLNEFLPDTQQIGLGLVVGQQGWEQVLENNKVAFGNEFVGRARFTTAFPSSMTPAQFVDQLNVNAGNALSLSERNQLVADLTAGTKTRAEVLRAVTEDADLKAAEFNRAFVLMQYFGYLRRNPNDTPDSDYTGYDFWLTKLDQFGGNFVNAEMVKAFILSGEYRQRFGP